MRNTIICTQITLIILLLSACNENSEYQVYAIKFSDGWRIGAKDLIIGSEPADSVVVCNMFWLIKGSTGKCIMVDAGFIDSTHTSKNYVRPDSMLLKLGISASQISDIILTHPHYDHISGIVLFPEATIWMQQDDYQYFTGPAWQEGGDRRGFEKKDVENIIAVKSGGRLKLIEGDDKEIFPGIRVYTGSKHTFQNQYLLVNSNSEKNKILLASDAIWFYLNLEKFLPVSICQDTAAYVQAMRKMVKMAANHDLIIPGHDNKVFSKFPKVQDWIVRIEE